MTALMVRPAEIAARFPLYPLARLLGIRLGCIGGQQPGQLPEGLADLAERLAITHRSAQRLHEHGLTWAQADRYACRAGLHPKLVWPDWDVDAPGEEDLADRRCRCRPDDRRPVGDLCDRCGRSIRHAHDDAA